MYIQTKFTKMSEQTTFNFRLKASQLAELRAISKKRGTSLSAHLVEAGLNYVYTKESDVYTKKPDVYTESAQNVYTSEQSNEVVYTTGEAGAGAEALPAQPKPVKPAVKPAKEPKESTWVNPYSKEHMARKRK